MEILRSYLQSLPTAAAREEYATRAGTTLGYLWKLIYTNGRVGGVIARRLDEESGGVVPRAVLRPDIFGETTNE